VLRTSPGCGFFCLFGVEIQVCVCLQDMVSFVVWRLVIGMRIPPGYFLRVRSPVFIASMCVASGVCIMGLHLILIINVFLLSCLLFHTKV
jgi:hypothetical protein